MQIIIAPTDFSEISLNAVNYAADMALSVNAKLLILHAIELPMNAGRGYAEPKDNEIEVESKLDTLKRNILERTASKIPVQSKQVTGFIENEIIKMCEYQDPLAVVMATKGASVKERFFIGSITVYLSKNLKQPVLIVPPGISYKHVTKVLLATDLENLYDIPVENILNIVNAFNATLDIIHVYNNEEQFGQMSARVSELGNYLKSANPQFHFIKNADVAEAVLDFASENHSDLVLTIPKRHTFFYKSKSKQLIFNSPLAVMTMQ